MHDSSADWLLHQSHNYPLLTAEQEIIFSRHIQQWLLLRNAANPSTREQAIIRRGRRAYDRFFLSNIRMVVHMANRYQRFTGTLGLDDLIQEGLIGLERAIVKYDATRGYKFSTYAFNWIRQSINRSLSSKSRTIRLPDNAILVIKKAFDYMTTYERQHGRRPTLEQMAEHCNTSPHTLRGYLPHGAPMISLDDRARNDSRSESSTLLELIADEVATNELDEYGHMAPLVQQLLADLPDMDRAIVQRLYMNPNGESCSLKSLSQEFGVSRQAISLRHRNALRRLRFQLNRAELLDTPELQYAA
jgi:RNA polymerase sigma factor (sigma-70 family)